MTSIIKVDQLEKTDGSAFTFGKVLQVKQTVMTSTAIITSTSFTEVLGLTTSITPSSASSKILVDVNMNVSASGHYDVKLQADGTDILLGDADGVKTRSTYHGYLGTSYNGSYDQTPVSIKFLHSPNTTSAVTYKIVAGTPYSSSYTVTVNRTYHDTNASYSGRTASTVTLTEIAG